MRTMTRILHVLDHSLPMHSGYTFRTRAILKAQEALGWQVRGVTGLRHTQDGPSQEEADGLKFYRSAGQPVGSAAPGRAARRPGSGWGGLAGLDSLIMGSPM